MLLSDGVVPGHPLSNLFFLWPNRQRNKNLVRTSTTERKQCKPRIQYQQLRWAGRGRCTHLDGSLCGGHYVCYICWCGNSINWGGRFLQLASAVQVETGPVIRKRRKHLREWDHAMSTFGKHIEKGYLRRKNSTGDCCCLLRWTIPPTRKRLLC